jgi:MFS family permease
MITNFSIPFASTALNIAVPHIGREFHTTATGLTWIVLSFIMVTALLSVPFGKIADMYGRMRMLKTGIILFCVAAFLNIFASTMTAFLIFRILQGVGGAMVFATNIAIAVDASPAGKRGFVLGLTSAAVYIGATCGPVVGGLITHGFGWRGVFVLMAALTFVAFIAAVLKLPGESGKEVTKKLSGTSILLYIVSLGLFLYGLTTLTQNLRSYIFFVAGIMFMLVLIKHEVRTETPLIEIRLFKGNREFSLSTLAALFNYAAIFAVSYFISIYLQLVKGFSADVSGLIMICQPIVQSVLSPISGRLSDRKSPGIIASIGMA